MTLLNSAFGEAIASKPRATPIAALRVGNTRGQIFGAYFIANTAVENATGKSIGDYIGESLQNPIAQGGYQYQTQSPDF